MLSASVSGPWCLAGDFNIVLYDREKTGGAPVNQRSVNSFASCLADCNLFDLGFSGSPFTFHRSSLKERLDRVVCNSAWQQLFPSSSVIHLPLSTSDHCGLWLRPSPETNAGNRHNYFKFLGSCLDHPDFSNQVRNSWTSTSDWQENVDRITANLKTWNRNVFGNIFKRKERILKRLEGINRVIQEGNSDHLIRLKSELWEEYRQITQQEENYWFQQARSKWITLGDNNTRYFHQSTLVRRCHNKIMALQDANDQWIYDEDDLKQHVLDFYHQLYSTSGQVYPNFISITTFPNISDVDMNYLGSTVTSHECISSASMSINWNGDPTSKFYSSRGLRQGDPLSPYLFVLALERLGHYIQDRVNNGSWKPLSFGRGGPKVSHICFADDLVLVAEANMEQVILIKDVLDSFCSNSGQQINLNKSRVFFSRNIAEQNALMLSQGLGIEQTNDLGIYLGAPMKNYSGSIFSIMHSWICHANCKYPSLSV
ncbi:hypothetical protein TSUD_63510 [Trifolium subterraneum]|uniref:Uncharacterized protein n=1 Tax=Trifolium subterraneum TaxID=3900 RepID=A0A2Z6MWQ9_TRISU|nr:hypothetical protein TSUD_63510 [Trifolium subterraneum]